MTDGRTRDLAERLREAGVVDTHFHVGPEFIKRRYDVLGLAEAAREWNATLVLKNHTYPTTPLASLARKQTGVRLLGGTVLNRFVGGLNPDAVWSAVSGNRSDVQGDDPQPPFVVWMPTVHAISHLNTLGHAFDPRWGGCSACTAMGEEGDGEEPVPVFSADGTPVPELRPVLEAIAAAGARLATGHLHAAEIMRLVPMALEAGIPAVLLTHPHYPSVELSDEQLCQLAGDERVFIEHCFAIHTIEDVPLERFVRSIEATGPEQVILSTDFGQAHSAPFPECTVKFAAAIDALRPAQFTEDHLVAMCTDKGGARAVNLVDAEGVAHAFESVLIRVQRGELLWSGEAIEACHNAVAAVGELVAAAPNGSSGVAEETVGRLAGLRNPPAAAKNGAAVVEEAPMTQEERELLEKLLPIFRAEADERLESIANALAELRAGPESREKGDELFESVMRDAHSLKGGARTMKLSHVSAVCKEFEYAAARLVRKEVEPYPELYDLFERAADLVQSLLESPENLNEGLVHQMMEDLSAAERPVVPEPAPVAELEEAAAAEAPVAEQDAPQRAALPTRASQSVRVATEKLDAVLRQSQEMLVAKLAMRERAAELRDVASLLREWQAEWSRVDTDVYRLQSWVEKNDEQSDPAGIYSFAASATRFLEWSQKTVRTMESSLRVLGKQLFEDQQSFGVMVDTLVDDTKRALMLPLSTLFKGLPRMVREVARGQDKNIDFDVRGDDVEVDKRILDEMRDPLMHLLRNCVDHGIEAADERETAGKPSRGSISIEVTQSAADEVEMLVQDDGRGIDTERVRAAAVKNGVITESQAKALGADESMQLIFRSGVSTSARVSNISGRGLGMAICREGVERLGGRIKIESNPGGGTLFRISLPLALATYRVLLLQVGRETLAVPTVNAERVVRLTPGSVRTEDGRDKIDDRGRAIPLERLDRFLGLESGGRPLSGGSGSAVAAILRSGDREVAFAVDRVIDEQEVLFKDLGSYLVHVPNVSGATILGTGTVVPILNAPELLDAVYAEQAVFMTAPEAQEADAVEEAPKSILVVEDSITSRMLLKEILESAGYLVSTAINGAEAVTTMEQGEFDIVVSDVEMPRMNGFELTERIRGDERWTGLPVILVTGLERDEERERGFAAGADEYIIKGSFEQSNLLEAIQRLCGET